MSGGQSPHVDPSVVPTGGPLLIGEDRCDNVASGVLPVRAVDGVILVERWIGDPSELTTEPAKLRAGSPCGTSTEPAACELALAHPPDAALRKRCHQIGCGTWILGWTAGDQVGWVSTAEGLKSFLGDIDTPAEARLIAWQMDYDVECETTKSPGGYTLGATRQVGLCPLTIDAYELQVTTDGAVEELSKETTTDTVCIGRLPPGLQAAPPIRAEAEGRDAVADWLADAAHLEASAVHAFDTLARELAAHGAPAALVAAARRARADEVRHAREVGALARSLGGEVAEVVVFEVPIRSLEEIAIDNAEEGLVRETWGAVVGAWQAAHAERPEVRALMTDVAEDEARHAGLSHALHRWLATKLDADALRRVERAREQAWRRMLAGTPLTSETSRALGVPTGPVAEAMLAVLALADAGVSGSQEEPIDAVESESESRDDRRVGGSDDSTPIVADLRGP